MNAMPGFVEVDFRIADFSLSLIGPGFQFIRYILVSVGLEYHDAVLPQYFCERLGGSPNRVSCSSWLSLFIALISEGSIARAVHLIPAREGLARPNDSSDPTATRSLLKRDVIEPVDTFI